MELAIVLGLYYNYKYALYRHVVIEQAGRAVSNVFDSPRPCTEDDHPKRGRYGMNITSSILDNSDIRENVKASLLRVHENRRFF